MNLPFRIVTLLAIIAACFAGCSRTTDEQAIRQALDDMAQAVEAKQPKRVLAHVAQSFQGPEGLDYNGVRGLMAYQFMRNENVKLFVTGLRIEVKGQGATVRFNAAVSGAQGLMPERLQYYAVELEWWKDKKQWSIVQANWRPALADDPS